MEMGVGLDGKLSMSWAESESCCGLHETEKARERATKRFGPRDETTA